MSARSRVPRLPSSRALADARQACVEGPLAPVSEPALVPRAVPFELRQLHYFVTVADEGQMTRAAEALHLAQPALSQAIAQLERHVGVRLLRRHARGVDLTPAGSAFVEKARATVAAAQDADSTARSWARGEAGEVVVGFPTNGVKPIEAMLERFRARHPDVQLDVRELDLTEQLTALRAGRVDVEFVCPMPHAVDLVTEPLCTFPRFAFMSDGHRLASEPFLTFAQIADETYPGRHPAIPDHLIDWSWLTAERGGRPAVTRETPVTPGEVVALLAGGTVISVGPEYLAPAYAAYGLVAVPLADVEPAVAGLAYRNGDDRATVRAFVAAAGAAAGAGHPVTKAGRAATVVAA
jgi:DNA-binding transcriptional LysR family regulator